MDDWFVNALLFFALISCVFLLLREVMTWYWKQNEIVSLLKEQNRLLRFLIDDSDKEKDEIFGSSDVGDDDTTEIENKKKTFKDKVKEAEEELKNKD